MHAYRVVEFSAICERLAHHCETALGAAQALDLRPSFEAEEVWTLLQTTGEAHDALSRYPVPGLARVRDLRQALKRAKKGGVLGGKELFEIGDGLAAMRLMRSFLEGRDEEYPRLTPLMVLIPEATKVELMLLDNLESNGDVRDSASTTLGQLRAKKRGAASRIQERIQSYVNGRTRELLSDPIFTTRDGRYVIPLKAENRGKIRGIVHDTSSSGQTIFVEPEDVLQLGNALREIEAAERTEEYRILTEFSGKVGAIGSEISLGIETCGTLDLHFAKARLAFEMKGSPPNRAERGRGVGYIDVQAGRHPLLPADRVVPVNISVGVGNSVLITGPNTGGKTVAIKCVGLFVLMAQSGMFPSALTSTLSPFTQIWADIGDEQSLEQSLSTFSGHIKNIAEALRKVRPGALILLDEIGAGTDPAEGAALAKSILQQMADRGAAILASTHYGELKAFAYSTDGFTNAAMEFDPKTLQPTYRLLMGAPGASQALRIAEKYGIPKEVVDRAREGLGLEAQDMALMLEQLEQSQRLARLAQSEADKRSAELKKAEQIASRKLAEADEIRRNAHSKAHEVIEAALREIRLEASQLFEELKKAPRQADVQDRVRKGLRDLDTIGRDFANEFVPKQRGVQVAPTVSKGTSVRMAGYTQVGLVLDEPKNGKVNVQIGQMKLNVAVSSLELAEGKKDLGKPRSNVRLQKAINAVTEIHLRHMRAEEAERDLERFVDDAVLSGVPWVRIVHGKGEGVLRKVTQDTLRRHPAVRSFRDGEPAEGGQGVTIASFE